MTSDKNVVSDRSLIGNSSASSVRGLADVVSASQCRRQADLCMAEAHCEADAMVQTALRSMADAWLTLEKQIEWIAQTRARSVEAIGRVPSGTGLQRGEVQGYDVDRMIVQFTMIDDGRVIPCAISSAAMDIIEGRGDVKPDQRMDQFLRLRDVIEKRATSRFLESPPQPNRPLVLRSNDF